MFHIWNQVFGIMGFLQRFPNINLACCWEQCDGRPISSGHITYLQSSDVHVLWWSRDLFRLLALISEIRGSAVVALLWILDLWRSGRTGFVETGTSRPILNPAVTFAAVVLWFLGTVPVSVGDSFHLVSGLGHCSSLLMMSYLDLCMPS